MALPPVKVVDTANTTVNAATLKLKVPYNTAIKSGIQTELLQPNNKNRLTAPMDGRFGSVTGINVGTYAVVVLADATNNWLVSQSPNVEPDIGQRVWVSASSGVPGGLAAATDYYVVGNIKQTASGGIQLATTPGGSVIDITSAGSGTVRVTPMDRPFGYTGTRPTSGVGGTPTIAVNTSSPCSLTADFIFTSDGFTGAFASWPFTIDASEKAQALSVEFKYQVSNIAALGVQVWVHDITNGVLIPVTPYQLSYTPSLSGEFSGQFQTSSNSTSYELIIYRAADSAALGVNGTVKINEISVARKAIAKGSVSTEPADCTITGTWTNTTYTCKKWLDASGVMHYRGRVACTGVPANTGLTLTLPIGDVIDTAKFPSTPTAFTALSRAAQIVDESDGSRNYLAVVQYASTTTVRIRYTRTFSGNAYVVDDLDIVPNNGASSTPFAAAFASGDYIDFYFSVPLVGKGSSQVTSSQEDGRVCALRATNVAGTSISNSGADVIVPFASVGHDTHGAWNGTDTYTVAIPGKYRVQATINFAVVAYASGNLVVASVYKNGVAHTVGHFTQFTAAATSYATAPVFCEMDCVAGDTIKVYVANNRTAGATALNTGVGYNTLSISRISGPAQIAASETVKIKYATAAGQSIPNLTTTIVNYGTKISESHAGQVTTGASWKWTCGVAGTYLIVPKISWSGAVAGGVRDMYIYKNGVAIEDVENIATSSASTVLTQTQSTIMDLVVGDYIDIRVFHNAGGAATLYNATEYNSISIVKQGL